MLWLMLSKVRRCVAYSCARVGQVGSVPSHGTSGSSRPWRAARAMSVVLSFSGERQVGSDPEGAKTGPLAFISRETPSTRDVFVLKFLTFP